MRIFDSLSAGFVGMRFRDQAIAIGAVAATLALGGNLFLIKPLLLELNKVEAKEASHLKALEGLRKTLADIQSESARGIDPFAGDRAKLKEFQEKIAEAESLAVVDGVGASQIGILVRSVIAATPGLTLVSLKTLPSSVFYSPPAPPPPPKTGAKAEVDKVLSQLKKEEPKKAPPVVLIKKTLYKHGITVTVRGSYPVLLSYMNELRKAQQRVYWGNVDLEAKTDFRDASLNLSFFTISDQTSVPVK